MMNKQQCCLERAVRARLLNALTSGDWASS
jgi:hypothetical protein